MNARNQSVLADSELVRMLAHEPQLLAIADALVVSSPSIEGWLRPEPRRLRLPYSWKRLAPAAATLAAVVAIFLTSPWDGHVQVVDRALAAVGTQPVLHVAIVQSDAPGSVVSLRTGEAIHREIRTDIWFDEERDLKRTVLSVDGGVLDEQLETREGGLSRIGPIYTCQWIASHPAEAQERGVSCDPSNRGDEEVVSVDPALAEFADGYRQALASGQAVVAGEDEIEGRDVVWLELENGTAVDRVAVDAASYRPVLVESRAGHTRYQVLTAETVPFQPSLFKRPQPERVQVGSSVISSDETTPEAAARTTGGTLFWLGNEAQGLRLATVEQQVRSVRFNDRPARETVMVIKLTYRPTGDASSRERVELYQARTCLVSTGWTCSARDPASSAEVGYPVGRTGPALVQRDGVYISIWGSAALHKGSLETARALVATNGGG